MKLGTSDSTIENITEKEMAVLVITGRCLRTILRRRPEMGKELIMELNQFLTNNKIK